tara:strand:- start:406 stop:1248 length:843 start_codon:yes stop_codon:yes gene_type:complete
MSQHNVHESFLLYRSLKFMWLAIALVFVCILLYVLHSPLGEPSGSSWLGYTLGCISATLVIWLSWFGIRKRQYALGTTKLKVWLSAHIYFGLALVVIATLHSGFQIGWNIHSVAYVLMLLTVISGIFGVYIYARYPKLMTKNRAGLSMEEMMGQISELDQQLLEEGQRLPEEINTALLKAARETYIGGNILEKISPKRIVCPTTEARNLMETKFADMTLHDQGISKIIALLAKKTKLLRRARRDVQIKVILRIWLFFHIPLAVGLLGALFSHVLAVFFYW